MKKKTNLQLLLDFLKGSKRYFSLFFITSVMISLSNLLIPQIVRLTIDNALGGAEADYPNWVMNIVNRFGGFEYLGENLWIMALAIIVIAFFCAINQYISRVMNTTAAERLSKSMRDNLFSHIQKLPYEWHMKNHTGDIIQRCTSDVQTVRNFISEQLAVLVLMAIKIFIGYYFMFSMNVKLSIYALIAIPFIIAFTIKFGDDMKKGFKKCDEMEGVVSAMVQENLTGVRVVRAFGKERYEKDRFEKTNGEYTNLWIGMGKVMGRFWSVQDLLTGIQGLLVLAIGAKLCVEGELLAGEYVTFLSYNAMLSTPIRRIGRIISEMSKADVAIDRIAYIMNSELEIENENALKPSLKKDIEFRNINFSYDGKNKILKDVSFTIPQGSTLGILGGTGSGKSTLMLLLDKMYELKEGHGNIYIGGVDINDINTAYLRERISIVLQEPYLYSRSIADNISITNKEMTMEEIKNASKSACLDEAVEGFSKGYDTFVGERGVTLSGGQKQRAAIARALTKNADIFIFDDSMSAVDTNTDARIRKALEERFGTATIIIISHRITTLSKADNILVLEDGRISEFGSPNMLKESGGLYSKIYDIQTGNERKEEK